MKALITALILSISATANAYSALDNPSYTFSTKAMYLSYCITAASCQKDLDEVIKLREEVRDWVSQGCPGVSYCGVYEVDFSEIGEKNWKVNTLDRTQKRIADYKSSESAYAKKEAEWKAESARLAKLPGVRIGMTTNQVLTGSNWGKPNSVNRTTTSSGVREQWVYGDGNYLYFTNNVLTAIQN